jgi:hypothetical protein
VHLESLLGCPGEKDPLRRDERLYAGMNDIQSVLIIEPTEMKGGRRFLVRMDGLYYTARVRIIQTNPYKKTHYRVLMYTINGTRIRNGANPEWKKTRKSIMRAIMTFKDETGMSPTLARV